MKDKSYRSRAVAIEAAVDYTNITGVPVVVYRYGPLSYLVTQDWGINDACPVFVTLDRIN